MLMYVVIFLIADQLLGLGVLKSLMSCLGISGFDNPGSIAAAEPIGQNETFQAAENLGRTPSSCFPQQTLQPEDLLPTDESQQVAQFNASRPDSEGILTGINLLDSGYHVGTNTIGQSLRNANRQLRSEPPNPQVSVSPWQNTTIAPDLPRRPLEVGESCSAGNP